MALGLNPKKLRQITLASDGDKPAAERTVFLVRTLSWQQRLAAIEYDPHSAAQVLGLVKAGLAGWRGFTDEDGDAIPFELAPGTALGIEGEYVTDECISALDIDQLGEIAQAVIERSGLKEDDRKKS